MSHRFLSSYLYTKRLLYPCRLSGRERNMCSGNIFMAKHVVCQYIINVTGEYLRYMALSFKHGLLSCICLFILCCSAGSLSVRDRFEGARDGMFRVFVQINIPVSMTATEESRFFDSLDKSILTSARHRASLLTAGLSDTGTGLRGKIFVNTSGGTIVFQKCTDTGCEAYVDFPLKQKHDETGL